MKPLFYGIPETSARDLGEFLKEKFGVSHIRTVGNLDSKIEKVFFCEHVNGGKNDMDKLSRTQRADAIISMEICDYTLSLYVKDCEALNCDKVIYEIGHFNVEELGMKYMCEWLPEAIGTNDISIRFVPVADYYKYI